MDKAVIFGTFEFVGFHFCTRLLEKGMEVVGIHQTERENDIFLTDKRLTIGRNANFIEVDMNEWLPLSKIIEQTIVIIDYYDYYIKKQIGFFKKHSLVTDFLQRNLQALRETNSPIIMLLPIQWLSPKEIENFLFPEDIPSHRIYLPTIYGPWQSNIFMFQQALLKSFQKREMLSLNEREWTYDAIYIDDVVFTTLKLIDKPADSYLLKSATENQWLKCAQSLSIPLTQFFLQERNIVINQEDIIVEVVKSSLLISEGIEEQKKHLMFSLKG